MGQPLPLPIATKCPSCGTAQASTVCSICKTDKIVPVVKPPIACRYFPHEACDCRGMGFCLDVA